MIQFLQWEPLVPHSISHVLCIISRANKLLIKCLQYHLQYSLPFYYHTKRFKCLKTSPTRYRLPVTRTLTRAGATSLARLRINVSA